MKNNKKGFTIVELVIVIAVIAILAAVLIPTFSGVVDKANNSAALQTARSTLTNALNMSSTATLAGKDASGKYQTVIVVDGKYAFGYNGNQLEQMVYPTATTKLSNVDNFNAVLIAAENLSDGVNNAASASFVNTNVLSITNVAAAISSASNVNGGSAVNYEDQHYYLNKHTAYTKVGTGKQFDPHVSYFTLSGTTYSPATELSDFVTGTDYYTASEAYDAEVFINSDFAKNVVVFTTFSK